MTWMYLGPISRLSDPLYPICFAKYIMSSDNEEEVYIGHFSSVDQIGSHPRSREDGGNLPTDHRSRFLLQIALTVLISDI